MPLTAAQFYAAELYFEPAATAILTAAGFQVVSAFVPVDADGNPDLTKLKDTHCYVLFDLAGDDGSLLSFRTGEERDESQPTGLRGQLRVFHSVAHTDTRPVAPGTNPGCYKSLCLQRGRIRALFLAPGSPFAGHLPADFDILSITLAQPDPRRADAERHAHRAVEVFDIRFAPADTIPEE